MGLADLHIHTTYSDGMATVSAVLEVASRSELDVIAITDHDTVAGALEARERAGHYGVQVIPGTEITTAEGHLLALFVDRRIPSGRSLVETVLRVADLGGLCIAPHLLAPWMHSLTPNILRGALELPEVAQTLVGIEVFNGGLPFLGSNRRAQAFANQTSLTQLANSDAHLLWTIGLFGSSFPGTSIEQLRRALKGRMMRPVIQPRPAGYYPSFVKGLLLRRAGLAWTAGPGEDIVLRPLAEGQA